MVKFSSLSRKITATYIAQLGSSLGTKMPCAVLVILAGKILVFLAALAIGPVLMIQVIANTYRMHLVRAIMKRMMLRDPKLGRYRAQEMVSSEKLAPWLELHPGFVEHVTVLGSPDTADSPERTDARSVGILS